jgi:signal transduction histidine kinase
MDKLVKILYIEDDPGSQQLVSRVLQAEGYQVVLAGDGLEGLQKATTEMPNLILMDINISQLDGYEVTTRLRSLNILHDVPIVALTANVLKGDKERALIAGCDGYISKPIDVDTLPEQVNTYLKGYRETIPLSKRFDYLSQYNRQVVGHLESKVVELQKAHEALQKLEKMKSDFIILAAHELRTPLTLAYGYARLLVTTKTIKSNPDTGDEQVKYLAEKIFSSVNRLNEVVNDIINIALIQTNKMELNIQSVSLEQAVNSALIELDPLQKGRDLVINIEPLGQLPSIDGDEDRVRQVFWNLLSNAVKYTPDGGSIFIGGLADETYVYVYVKDTGIGIPSEEQEKIFGHFYVTEDTDYHSSSKVDFMGGGMGIGLGIVKGILKAHQAEMWVESSGVPGEGATFYVKFPIGKLQADS